MSSGCSRSEHAARRRNAWLRRQAVPQVPPAQVAAHPTPCCARELTALAVGGAVLGGGQLVGAAGALVGRGGGGLGARAPVVVAALLARAVVGEVVAGGAPAGTAGGLDDVAVLAARADGLGDRALVELVAAGLAVGDGPRAVAGAVLGHRGRHSAGEREQQGGSGRRRSPLHGHLESPVEVALRSAGREGRNQCA